ncbi:hypothetical protein [Methylobacterium currus]|uniref:hypothetical protein n=1 Tax=Methylobacterium currus TaxID=2051553 RepID=UPI001FD3EFD7|nr:hypothetical protein [Methylobacterium currus]
MLIPSPTARAVAALCVTEIAGGTARQALGVLVLAGGLTSTIVWPLSGLLQAPGLLQAQWGWRATTLAHVS